MAFKLASIFVSLSAETAGYVAGLKKSRRETSKFARSVKSSLTQLVALGGAAGFGGLVIKSLNLTDQLGKFSKSVDFSTKKVQELRFSARQMSIEVRGVDDSMRRFTRRVGLFAQDGGGPAAKAFKQLGIEIRDSAGQMRSNEAIFADVVRGIADLKTTAEQSAVASQIFGDDFGPKLVPLLAKGEKGLADYAKQAEELGLIIDESLIEDAEEARSKMDALAQVIAAKFNVAVARSADEIGTLVTALSTAIETIGTFAVRLSQSVGERIAQFLHGSDDPLIRAAERLGDLEEEYTRRRTEFNGANIDPSLEELNQQLSVARQNFADLLVIQTDFSRLRRELPQATPSASIPSRIKGAGFSNDFIPNLARQSQELIDASTFDLEVFTAPIMAAEEQYESSFTNMQFIAQGFVGGISGVFADMFLGIQSGSFTMKDVFVGAIRQMAASLIQSGLLKLLSGLLPGGAGEFFKKLLPTTRHSGGPIEPGRPYRVQKDETIIPTFAGQVVPAGGGSFQSNTTINTNGGIDRRRLLDMTLLLEERDERLKMEIAQAFRNGGF